MSRYFDWTRTHDGIINYLINYKKINCNKASDVAKKLICEFTKEGSFSERCLLIKKDFNKFKLFIDFNLNKLN